MLSARMRDPLEGCADDNTVAAYLEASLTDRERAAFEAHVSECRTCQEVLALSLELQDAETAARAIARQGAGKRILFRVSVPVPVLAALIIAVVVGAVLFRNYSKPQSAEPRPMVHGAPLPLPEAYSENAENRFQASASSVRKAGAAGAALPIESPAPLPRALAAGPKKIGDKEFYPVSGYWMDRQCGEHWGDPMVPITSDAPEYEQILSRYPELSLLRPALVCGNGKVYILR
jgi:hypothetical protein